MAGFEVSDSTAINSRYMSEVTASYNSFDERNPLRTGLDRESGSPEVIRPCYYLLQILGMWRPKDGKFGFTWGVYRLFVYIFWLGCLVAIMCLDFVHYGFDAGKIHFREIINSVGTCLVFVPVYVHSLLF